MSTEWDYDDYPATREPSPYNQYLRCCRITAWHFAGRIGAPPTGGERRSGGMCPACTAQFPPFDPRTGEPL